MARFTIEAATFYQDGGDGGGGTSIYPNLEALKADRFSEDDYDSQEEADAAYQAVIDGDDPYGNGEIGSVSIEIEVDENGVPSLADDFYIHWGQ